MGHHSAWQPAPWRLGSGPKCYNAHPYTLQHLGSDPDSPEMVTFCSQVPKVPLYNAWLQLENWETQLLDIERENHQIKAKF